MSSSHLQPTHHYIRLSMQPRCTDVLLIRKSIQDALAEMFGLTFASTYIDILFVSELGSESVVRVNPEYVQVRGVSMPMGSTRPKRRSESFGCYRWSVPCFDQMLRRERIFISPVARVRQSWRAVISSVMADQRRRRPGRVGHMQSLSLFILPTV